MSDKLFGLVGYPLSHSFSKIYFEDKFRKEGLNNYKYELFELKSIDDLPELLKNNPNLMGLNVTSPYKTAIMKYVNFKTPQLQNNPASNCIKIKDNKLYAYNTDTIGFEKSLIEQTDIADIHSALILGTGGAAISCYIVLNNHNIKTTFATRQSNPQIKENFSSKIAISSDFVNYDNLKNLEQYDLIVNATPCSMNLPPIKEFPYEKINSNHVVFDLIYNPSETFLLNKAKTQGAKTINGLNMLRYQAEASWEIWQ